MDELLSLKGLVTVAISSILTIKAWHINLCISRDININGNNNIVTVNKELSSYQHSFKLIWGLSVVWIALTYPFWGKQYNSILSVLALISTPLALVSFAGTIRGYGWTRIYDIFYVVGTAVICWIVYGARGYLLNTATDAQQIYPTIEYLQKFNSLANFANALSPALLLQFVFQCVSVAGFSIIFLSLLYFLFAHLTARNFDDSIRFFAKYIAMGIIGFFATCNGFLALIYLNFPYIKELFGTLMLS